MELEDNGIRGCDKGRGSCRDTWSFFIWERDEGLLMNRPARECQAGWR